MLLMLFIIEFAFVFSAVLGVNYASRNAALAAAEAGNDKLADCVILQQVEESARRPGRQGERPDGDDLPDGPERVSPVRHPDVHPRRDDDLHQGDRPTATSLTVPYSSPTGSYTWDQRCNFLNGCPDLGRPQIDTIGIQISYDHTWVTPIRNFGLAGTGATLTQSNAMRMEPHPVRRAEIDLGPFLGVVRRGGTRGGRHAARAWSSSPCSSPSSSSCCSGCSSSGSPSTRT